MQNNSRIGAGITREDSLERDCINNVKRSACSDSFSFLTEKHSAIFYKIYLKYSNLMFSFGYEKDSIESDKNLVFLNSINSFNEERKTKFSTWLANQTRFFCLNFINKQKNNVNRKNFSDMIDRTNEPIVEFNENMMAVNDALGKISDERIRKVIKYRYFSKDPSWREISNKLKCSIQTSLNLHKKGKIFLKKMLTK